MENKKNIYKLSSLLLDAVYELKKQRLRQIQNKFSDFGNRCSFSIKDSHLFYKAVEKNWFSSAEKIRTRVSRNLNDLTYQLQRFKEFINIDEPKLPKLSDIFAELSQIDQELGEYQFDLKDRTISVITEPITLEEIDLGSFEIRLFIEQISTLYEYAPYKVIALEPNPAGSDDNVTHPHVSSQTLCEGEGHVSIRRALEDGRFCDFFTIITNILQTYNPGSPYIRLEDWEGRSCYDCGYSVSGDESYYCEYCDNEFCDQCSTYCQKCDTTICLGCASQCPSCEEPVCQRCSAKCKECEEIYCKDCLTEEGLCPDCEEQRKENEDEEQEDNSKKSEAAASVQPDSMDEIDIHA